MLTEVPGLALLVSANNVAWRGRGKGSGQTKAPANAAGAQVVTTEAVAWSWPKSTNSRPPQAIRYPIDIVET